MKKIMGVDYGDARTGIAISDLLCSIVGSTTVIHSRRDDKTIAEIQKIIADNMVIHNAWEFHMTIIFSCGRLNMETRN